MSNTAVSKMDGTEFENLPPNRMYRKKPVVISAIEMPEAFKVLTLEGEMTGQPGDFLITGVAGEQYPCRKDIFEATYEDV